MRDEMIMQDKIKKIVESEGRTIPEIANALKSPTHEVVFWVMAMRKYGILEESSQPDDDGFYTYSLKLQE